MNMHGTFQINDWQETTQRTLSDETKLNRAKVTQSYSGNIEGTSEVQYDMFYGLDGNAHFTGFEFISGHIQGQACQLTLKHNGRFENGVASSEFTIIACSNLTELLGKSGHFVATQNGQAEYTLLGD